MAVSLSIRNLDDDTAERIRRRAARHGRSTEAEIRDILTRAAAEDIEVDWADLARRIAALSPPLPAGTTTAILREARNTR